MKNNWLALISVAMLNSFFGTSLAAQGGAVRLAELTPVSEAYVGLRVLRLDEHKSENSVTLGSKAFSDGIGVEASASLVYALKGKYKRLEITAGIGPGGEGFYKTKAIQFSVYGDGRLLYSGGEQRYGAAPVSISVPLWGVQRLELATRGPLVRGPDPRAAFWAGGRLEKADKFVGGVVAVMPPAQSAIGRELELSAFGEEGVLPEEYRFLREFIGDAGYQLGANLLITRNGAAAALDIAPAIQSICGMFAQPHLSSWNTRDFPISNRTYTVGKLFHGISAKVPKAVRFIKTASSPELTAADRERVEDFLGGIGAWNRGDILLIRKEGVEASLKDKPEDSELSMMKTFEREKYKTYQASPVLNLLEEYKKLAGDRAEVVAEVDKCDGKVYKPCTLYGIQIPRSRAENIPLNVKTLLYLLYGLMGIELLAIIGLGMLIFRRRRRLFKYYALFSAMIPAFIIMGLVLSDELEILVPLIIGAAAVHAPLLVVFLLFYIFMKPEYAPFRRAWVRWGMGGLKWLSLSSASLALAFIALTIVYRTGRDNPQVVETLQNEQATVKYVRTRPFIKLFERIPALAERYIGWAVKKNNKVTCYISLSMIDEMYADVERGWPGIYHRRDFRSRIIWNMLKNVPAGRRREYFVDLDKRSVLAHEMSHAEDYRHNPYADGRRNNNDEWINSEIKARLAGLQVSPFSLATLNILNKEYLPVRKKIFDGFLDYPDTLRDEDIAALPADEITKRAGEIYQRIVVKAGFAYWESKARDAVSPDEKLRYYKWALEKWDWEKDGKAKALARKAAALKELAALRWEKGDFSEAARGFAEMARIDPAGHCAALRDNATAQAFVRSPAATLVARKAYGEAYTACGNYYIHSDTVSEKGFAFFKAAVEIMPDSPHTYQEWGKAWQSRGRPGKAWAVLDLGVKNNPASAMMYLVRGSVRLDDGDSRNALDDLRKAVELDPKNANIRLLLARAYFNAGRRSEALQALQGDTRKLADIYHTRGACLFSGKDYEKAVKNIQVP